MKILLKLVCFFIFIFTIHALWSEWYESNTLNIEIGAAIEDNRMAALPGDQQGPLKMEKITILYTEVDKTNDSLYYVFGRNPEGRGVLVKVPAEIALGSMIGKTLHFQHQMVGSDRLGKPYWPPTVAFNPSLSKG